MIVSSYSYSEFWDAPAAWKVDRFQVGKINLIVGKNASGKSRVLNTLSTFASFIGGASIANWNSGSWQIEFTHKDGPIEVNLVIERGKVTRESVKIGGVVKLSREADGSGDVFYDQLDDFVGFKLPENMMAIVSRRDALQHPFLEPLYEWASSLKLFLFSTDMGKQTIHLLPTGSGNPESHEASVADPVLFEPNAVVQQYSLGYKQFGDAFDEAILASLAALNYHCSSVHAVHVESVPFIGGNLPVMLQLQEVDRKLPTRQFDMSTGMFRAFAILIHMNYALMSDESSSILIDDIGEGLDFERSKALVSLLIRKCINSDIQLIMTSNDRFVMNEVDLEFWHVLDRTGADVKVLDSHNASEQFSTFKYLGLSNFDFFSTKAYLGSVH